MWVQAQIFTTDWTVELLRHTPILIVRTLIAFVAVVLVVRWTGKRSIANLAPFDLAMVIMIGEVAAIPVADLEVDMLHGLLPVVLLGGLHVLITTVALISKRFERFTEGAPTRLIQNGQVLYANLRRERVSLSDLLAALRLKEITDPAEVEAAWIEHAGGISVIRQQELAPATRRDLEAVAEQIVCETVQRVLSELAERLPPAGAQTARPEVPGPEAPADPKVGEPDNPEGVAPENPSVAPPDYPGVTEPDNPDLVEPENPEVVEPEGPDVVVPEPPDVLEPGAPEPLGPAGCKSPLPAGSPCDDGPSPVGTFGPTGRL